MLTAVTPRKSIWANDVAVVTWVDMNQARYIDWHDVQDEMDYFEQLPIVLSDPGFVERQRTEDQFQRLRAQWRKERGITSSLTKIITSNAYLCIIGMGEKAVPLILDQLKKEGQNPDFWFWALAAITRENPVREEDVGNMRAMARAWLDWGRNH